MVTRPEADDLGIGVLKIGCKERAKNLCDRLHSMHSIHARMRLQLLEDLKNITKVIGP